MSRPSIRILDTGGSPEEMGAAHGAAHAAEIRHYATERVRLVASGLWSDGAIPADEVLDLAGAMLGAHERFETDVHVEMLAMADAAGITPAEAVIVGGFTDFVDTVRAVVGGRHPGTVQEDDCTAVLVPDHRADGAGFLAQTWDMHDSATDHVVLLRLRPDDAPAATVFTTTGCLGQIGMNELGVCIGINNLVALDGRPGVTWPSVVRAMLMTESASAALEVLLAADLAGAHNYLILDANGVGYNVEAMPSHRAVDRLGLEPLIHTNHVLDSDALPFQADKDQALMDSSTARLATAVELLADGPVDVDRLIELTREPTAICQTATDPYHIESSGATVMRPATRQFWACWGRPAENDFHQIPIARTGELARG